LKLGSRIDTQEVRAVLLASASRKRGDSARLLAGRLNVRGALALLKERRGAAVAMTRPGSGSPAWYSLNPEALKTRYRRLHLL
jgi:hypothetical protein